MRGPGRTSLPAGFVVVGPVQPGFDGGQLLLVARPRQGHGLASLLQALVQGRHPPGGVFDVPPLVQIGVEVKPQHGFPVARPRLRLGLRQVAQGEEAEGRGQFQQVGPGALQQALLLDGRHPPAGPRAEDGLHPGLGQAPGEEGQVGVEGRRLRVRVGLPQAVVGELDAHGDAFHFFGVVGVGHHPVPLLPQFLRQGGKAAQVAPLPGHQLHGPGQPVHIAQDFLQQAAGLGLLQAFQVFGGQAAGFGQEEGHGRGWGQAPQVVAGQVGAAQVPLGGDQHPGPRRRGGQGLQQVAKGPAGREDGVLGLVQEEQTVVRQGRGQGCVALPVVLGQRGGVQAQGQGDGAAGLGRGGHPGQGHEGHLLGREAPAGHQPAGHFLGQLRFPHAAHPLDERRAVAPQPFQHLLHLLFPAQEAGGPPVEGVLGEGGQGNHVHGAGAGGEVGQGAVVVAVLGQQLELAGLGQGPFAPQVARQVLVQGHRVARGGEGRAHGAAGEQHLVEAGEEGQRGPLEHALVGLHGHDVGHVQGVQGRGHALGVAGHHHGQAKFGFLREGGVEDHVRLLRVQGAHPAALVLEDEVALGHLVRLVAVAEVVEDREAGAVLPGQQGAHRVRLGHVGVEGGRGLHGAQGVAQPPDGFVHGHGVGAQRGADEEEGVEGGHASTPVLPGWRLPVVAVQPLSSTVRTLRIPSPGAGMTPEAISVLRGRSPGALFRGSGSHSPPR